MEARFAALKSRYFWLPIVSLVVLALTWTATLSPILLLGIGLLLVATVFVAVHHAEVVALRVGEPFGSLVLAVSVTVIEVGMIVVLILESPNTSQSLARDAIFAAVMISMNGIIGLSLLVRTSRGRLATFIPTGIIGAVAVLASLSALTLVLPAFTVSSSGPTFTTPQLIFAAVTSLVLYVAWLRFLTGQHRDYFLPLPEDAEHHTAAHVLPPSAKVAWVSFVSLVASLVGVVGLAHVSSPLIKSVVSEFTLPGTVIGVSIAAIVLLPETVSAIRAARAGRTQTSLNLGYGSAIASIGLSIPVLAILAVVTGYELNLGLDNPSIVLLLLTVLVSLLTVIPGRASHLNGWIHVSILGAFLAFVIMP